LKVLLEGYFGVSKNGESEEWNELKWWEGLPVLKNLRTHVSRKFNQVTMNFYKLYYRIVNLKLYKTYILPTCEAKYLSAAGWLVPDFALSSGAQSLTVRGDAVPDSCTKIAHIILCLLHSREKLTSRHQPPALPYFLPDSTAYISSL